MIVDICSVLQYTKTHIEASREEGSMRELHSNEVQYVCSAHDVYTYVCMQYVYMYVCSMHSVQCHTDQNQGQFTLAKWVCALL